MVTETRLSRGIDVKVSILNAQPVGFHTESYLKALNYSDLQNASLRGKAYLGTGAVLFKFSKFRDPVRITIDLRKTGGVESLGDETDLNVPANSTDKYVLFEDFPAGYLRNNRFCQYELWLLNMTANQEGRSTSVEIEVMYRTA